MGLHGKNDPSSHKYSSILPSIPRNPHEIYEILIPKSSLNPKKTEGFVEPWSYTKNHIPKLYYIILVYSLYKRFLLNTTLCLYLSHSLSLYIYISSVLFFLDPPYQNPRFQPRNLFDSSFYGIFWIGVALEGRGLKSSIDHHRARKMVEGGPFWG